MRIYPILSYPILMKILILMYSICVLIDHMMLVYVFTTSQSYFSNWMDVQVKGMSLSRALQCWDRSLQEANKNSKTALKGCPFHLIDTCQWPQCNPTCPALIDQATQQEMTLLQVLASMGVDLQKLGLDTPRDSSASSSMISNGG